MGGKTGKGGGLLAEYRRVQERLNELMDTNPEEAVVEARKVTDDGGNWSLLRASVLCDAGASARDLQAVEEASKIFTRLIDRKPEDGGLKYNLANALGSIAGLDRTPTPDWWLKTATLRRRARSLLGEAAKLTGDDDAELASRMLTNLGNGLDSAHRWVEAYECYQAALGLHPSNGVAAGCAARVLGRVASRGLLGHEEHLLEVSARLAHRAKEQRDVVARFAGLDAVKAFEALPSEPGPLETVRIPGNASDYERFVAEQRLVLSPVLEGLGHDARRWDDVHIASLTERAGDADGSGTPPALFAMFNVMKADYLVARELLFQGVQGMEARPRNDTGRYMDTTDSAVYGTAPSRLVLAQRAALDILDKISVALNEGLSFGLKAKEVTFHGFWREKPNEPAWRPALAAAIRRGNPALIALSEIAADLTDGAQEGTGAGILLPAKRARHAGTHRFVVLHDMDSSRARPSKAIDRYGLDEFRGTVLDTMRLARAALLHFLEAIAYAERARDDDGGLKARMAVRPHHEARREDVEEMTVQLRTRGRDGKFRDFEAKVDRGPFHDGEYWEYMIFPESEPLEPFYARLESAGDDGARVVMIEHHDHPEFAAMGIPEEVFEHMSQLSGRRVESSENEGPHDGTYRTPRADSMWKRICRSGRAVYDEERDLYEFIPGRREW